MTNASEKRAPLGTLRALLSILLAIAVLVAAQTLALLLGEILLGAGVPGPACNVLTAVLYVLFALGGAALLCRFVLRLPLAALRIGRLRIRPVWGPCGLCAAGARARRRDPGRRALGGSSL